MKKCKVCGNKTEVVFNIGFKATPICEKCATAIFLQQAKWYAETQGQELPIHDVVGRSEQLLPKHCKICKAEIKNDVGDVLCAECWSRQ